MEKGQLCVQPRRLKSRLKASSPSQQPGIQVLLDDIKKRILTLARAENLRKRRKTKQKAQNTFCKDLYTFAKHFFEEAKSGTLTVPRKALEAHLRSIYSYEVHDVPFPQLQGIPQPSEPGIPFDMSEYHFLEAQEFKKA